jgi:cobalt-zinc-cadmium efflux system membrane fusion protein
MFFETFEMNRTILQIVSFAIAGASSAVLAASSVNSFDAPAAGPAPTNAATAAPAAKPRNNWNAGATGTARPEREELLGCLLTPNAEAEVGSQVIGVLAHVLVERGDHVKKGQAIAQLEDGVERASADAASQRFENRAEIAAAKAAYEFAQRKADRARELVDKQFISPQALEQADSEAKVAAMRYAQAQEQRVVARQDMSVARAQLGLRTISSPISGVVVDRYMSAGERVEQKPIVKLAQIDPLRVEVVAPATRFNSIKIGTLATVTPELKDVGAMNAHVIQVDAVIDAASNTFRVRLEMPNPRGEIPSGLRCKIAFSNPVSH